MRAGGRFEGRRRLSLCPVNERYRPDEPEDDGRVVNGHSLSRFSPGQLLATQRVMALSSELGINLIDYLSRHVRGDWGDLCPEDSRANEAALRNGGRLLSAYDMPNGKRLWIITEADRSATTLLLPDEY